MSGCLLVAGALLAGLPGGSVLAALLLALALPAVFFLHYIRIRRY